MARVTLDHLVVGLEAPKIQHINLAPISDLHIGDLGHRELLMVGLLG